MSGDLGSLTDPLGGPSKRAPVALSQADVDAILAGRPDALVRALAASVPPASGGSSDGPAAKGRPAQLDSAQLEAASRGDLRGEELGALLDEQPRVLEDQGLLEVRGTGRPLTLEQADVDALASGTVPSDLLGRLADIEPVAGPVAQPTDAQGPGTVPR